LAASWILSSNSRVVLPKVLPREMLASLVYFLV
jgi:hypothetical protein